MKPRVLFLAGATGAVGRTALRLARTSGLAVVPHVRPGRTRAGGAPPGAVSFELSESRWLDEALAGCTTVLQLIGTTRARFASGDTYEVSDVGTTHLLVESAKRAGIDHFVLLSSVGAGRPLGAYLKAKARAEALVTGSGLPFTIFRPSAFAGEGHRPPPGAEILTRLPGLSRFRPVAVEALAQGLLWVAERREPIGAVLEGESLFALLAGAAQRFAHQATSVR
jgi:uncharacterized protein YbjT (DUF2867 family)